MIAPIGSFLTEFDTQMVAAMDTGIVGLCAKMFLPMIACAGIYYILKGLDIMDGDEGAIDELLPQTIRMGIAIVVASDPAWFNPILRDFIFTGIPAYLTTAVMQNQPGAGIQVSAGVNATAAIFDRVWGQLWVVLSAVSGRTGTFDVGTAIAVHICGLTGCLALGAMALVYLASRFILTIVLVLGVIVVALWVIPAFRKVLEQWIGKVASLIFLQVALVVTLTIVVSIDQTMMTRIAASPATVTGAATDLQMLISMVVLFLLGAFAIYTLPAIAYSLGGGIALSTFPAMALAYTSAKGAGKAAKNALEAIPPYALSSPPPSLNQAFAQGSGAAMPPPPPALASAAPLLLR